MSEPQPEQPKQLPARDEFGGYLALIDRATEKGVTVEYLRALMELKERHDANEARKAFFDALTAFKADPPEIFKNKKVRFETSKGMMEYDHATLDEVSLAIGTALSKHGLSHRWATAQKDGGLIEVTCTLSHQMGHSERTTLAAMPDGSGSKNSIQAVGSTVTYLERYTLLAATGMAAKGQDVDGKLPGEPIKEDQIESLQALLDQAYTSAAALERFMTWLKQKTGADSIAKLTQKQYPEIVEEVTKLIDKKKGNGK